MQKRSNLLIAGMLIGLVGLMFVSSQPVKGAPPTFTMTLPTATTYYGLSVDIRTVNTTNDVYNGWFRFNNGSWSTNITMTYNSGSGWWEYETSGDYWEDGDTYQIQAFLNATADAGIGMDSATMIIDSTPTFTITHPVSREHTATRLPVEYSVGAGAVTTPWNIWDGSAWVYGSNQTNTVASGLDWDTSYTLYAYAVDGNGDSASTTQTFSTGPPQGGAASDREPENTPPTSLPINTLGDRITETVQNNLLIVVVMVIIGLYLRKKKDN